LNTSPTRQIRELFKSPVDLESFLDDIPIGIVVLTLDREVLLLNRSLEGLIGLDRAAAMHIPCHQALRTKICVQNCPVNQLQRNPEPVCIETDLINRDRKKIPVRVTLAPLFDIEGNVAGYLESIEDMQFIRELGAKAGKTYSFTNLVGKSPPMEKIIQILPSIAQSDSSVLITGETGTGKDMVAEEIHKASERAKHPFIKVNCGALPENLLESELFGHQKGAFTGAIENRPGRFRLAQNGTLYLTEIGDLPLPLQVKLLTYLDDKIVYPLGSSKGIQTNVRIIAATHRNLEQMVQKGAFRQDLLFRLNVVRLQIPPLRVRSGDIRLLIDFFCHTLSTQMEKEIKGFSDNALRILLNFSYPGNVRELRNIIEYALNVCHGKVIRADHLPVYLTETSPQIEDHQINSGETTALDYPPNHTFLNENPDQDWSSTEKKMILDALVKARGRKSNAAELLGWGRSTLWRKMKQHNIK
jgi:two-component system, NtrC family, response regulator AtoC